MKYVCVFLADGFEEIEALTVVDVLRRAGVRVDTNLQKHRGLAELLRAQDEEGKWLAAICAAPSVLGGLGVLKGRKACCYPSFEESLTGAEVVEEPAVVDGHVVTGRGMGTAVPFALKLVEVLVGSEKAEQIKESILFA